MTLPFKPVVSVLDKHHNRGTFSSGKEPLDSYLRHRASQDLKRGLSAIFVLEGQTQSDIAGFYALSSLSIDAGDLTKLAAKRLPTQRPIPCTLLGQFAVDTQWQNKGVGGWLLVHILHEVLSHAEKIGSFALIVDAIDDEAKSYWLHCGFIPFPHTPTRLFVSMNTIRQWLAV
jgi:GNAT superfamily N-acetyltransferase